MPNMLIPGLVLLHALSSCFSEEAFGQVGDPSPHGAGRVVRIDPALDAIVPADYEIEKLAGGFGFTEGPVWVNEDGGYLLFSDIPANSIHKWSPGGSVSTFLAPVFGGQFEKGRFVGSNGLTLDKQGHLVLCEHGGRRVSRLGRDGQRTTLVDSYKGKKLNSPNDAVYRSDGWLYFTDPPYGLAKQDADPTKELDFNGVYRLGPKGELELLDTRHSRPNGIAFSPDEKTLYVANSHPARKTWTAYDVRSDGTLGDARVFYYATHEKAPGSPDGMKVDERGNLYCTGPGGVWIFDPQGVHLGTIQPPEIPANVAWGGADGRSLYMTARTGLYRIRLKIVGLRP